MPPKKQRRLAIPFAFFLPLLVLWFAAVLWLFGLGWASWLVAIPCALAILLLLLPAAIKNNILAQLPSDLEYVPAPIDLKNAQDAAKFSERTAQLEALGFVQSGDFGTNNTHKLAGTLHLRVFLHPQHGCVAQLFQVVAATGKPLPVTVSISSYFGSEEILAHGAATAARHAPIAAPVQGPVRQFQSRVRGYWISTTDRNAHWMYNMLRHPRVMSFQLKGTGPEELLQDHLEKRARLAARLGQAPDKENLLAVFMTSDAALRHDLHHRIARSNAFFLVGGAFLKGTPKAEYYGELGPH